ncbi:DUF2182 domain-containing protein (plasmid) [Microvirga sp. VF16]|nr:DUF2182 domain-containing protein [Microvirga sp. VF16]
MDMQAMGDMAMPMAPMPWSPGYFALIVAMWIVMMAAMMLPSAAPVILLYATIARRRRQQGAAAPAAGLFALGYVVVWAVFGLLAATLQWGLDAALLLSPLMATTSVAVAGLVLVAAGLYQWTPLKQACLRQCRSPLDFLLGDWREGSRGAVAMGTRHGLFCLGCCWMLMLLLFVGGVMNLLWIAVLALFVLIEKAAPGGHWIGRAAGAVLTAWGGAALLSLA